MNCETIFLSILENFFSKLSYFWWKVHSCYPYRSGSDHPAAGSISILFFAPKAHLQSSAKDGLGVLDFEVSEVTLILGFLEIFEFFLTEMERFTHVLEATIGPVVAPWIV